MSQTVTHRKRIEVSVRFRVRSTQKGFDRPVNLQIRLTVEGDTIGDYSSGILIRPDKWDQVNQKAIGRDATATAINEKIAEITLQHLEIYRELKRLYSRGQGPKPTAKLVKAEFRKPGVTSHTLDSWYGVYLDYLDSLYGTGMAKADKTLDRAYKTREHLRAFCDMAPQYVRQRVADKSPDLIDLTTGWGKRFFVWLQTDPKTGGHRMQADSAIKYLTDIRQAIDHAIDEGYLSTNPLDKYRPKRKKSKEVYFLEPDHLDKLMGLQLEGDMRVTVWWAKLMCLTGLDYRDAVRYAQNRDEYNRTTDTGKYKIVITRSKPPCNECEIFRLPEMDALFDEYPTGPEVYVLADVNRNLKVIAEAIGFPGSKPFSTKICRKTAGAHFLRMGFLISTVSKMLGHSSIRVTEEHYVKVRASHVDQDIERVSRFAEVRPINPVVERELFRRII